MGKVLQKVKNWDLPPPLRKEFSEVIHVKETGRIAIYGLEKGTRKRRLIKKEKLLNSYGIEKSKSKQKPAKAIWGGLSGGSEVTVIGAFDNILQDNHPLMKIRESSIGIPYKELEWVQVADGSPNDSEQNGSEGSPEVIKLQEEIDGLRSDMDNLRTDNKRLSGEVTALSAQVEQVLADNTRLGEENSRLKDENQRLEEKLAAYSGNMPIVLNRTPKESDNRFRRGFNRTSGWIGSKLPGTAPIAYGSGRIEEEDGRPAMIVEEETYDGYTYGERRRGAAAVIGAAALVGVAVLAAGLWGEHEEQEGRQSQAHKTIIEQNKNGGLQSRLKTDENQISKLQKQLRQAKSEIKHLQTSSQQEEHQENAEKKAGEVFDVEPGNGITNEIQDYAADHGYQAVSGGQAWMLYENMRQQFGTNLVELPDGANDTYIRQQGDVGISRPGQAKWPEQVEKFLQSRLHP